jgi:uncharacterized protein (DUF302 family)
VSRAFPSILATILALLVAVAATVEAQDSRPLKKIVVTLPFEEAEVIVKSEAQRQNLNLVNVLDIQKGMENRGQTFRPYRIYQFCNLEMGMRVLADSPDYGAFALCSIVIYEVDARQTALVSARQGWVLKSLPDHKPSPAAVAAARQFERIIDEIFDAVIEESKARSN